MGARRRCGTRIPTDLGEQRQFYAVYVSGHVRTVHSADIHRVSARCALPAIAIQPAWIRCAPSCSFSETPAVQGFAATLVIGLITNLFTSVFVSRVAFDWELSRRRPGAGLSIGITL